MHEILDYCTGGTTRHISGGEPIVREGGKSGHLFILIEGRLEVIKGDSVVAVLTEPGAVFGEMSVPLNRPHSASVRAASDSVVYELDDAIIFLREQPAVVLLIAQLLAQRLNVATTTWPTLCISMPRLHFYGMVAARVALRRLRLDKRRGSQPARLAF